MMKVNNVHAEYTNNQKKWQRARDSYAGQDAVKARRTEYLPSLNGQTPSAYDAYLERAVYTNFTRRTIQTAIGQMFRKEPVVSGLDENKLANIDGNDNSFSFFARDVASEILQTNRAGVLVDYDAVAGVVLKLYPAESIINWHVDSDGMLDLVVMELLQDERTDDPFVIDSKKIYLALMLDDMGIYVVRTFERDKSGSFVMTSEVNPIINGEYVNYVPFYFVTSQGVTEKIIPAPMNDFVDINLAHYRNSADFENLLHWTGAKTVITRGWGDRPFPVGGAADFPIDGGADFLQASSDSGLKDELAQKENRMAVLGSSMIAGKGRYVASAETQSLTSAGEYATLADMAGALSDAFSKILTFLNYWQTGSSEQVSVEINKDFELAQLNTGDLINLMGAVQSGMMSWETYFYQLKSREVYPDNWTMVEEKAAIEKNIATMYQPKQVENFETEPKDDVVES